MALPHPQNIDLADEFGSACLHLPAKGRSLILTSDMRVAVA